MNKNEMKKNDNIINDEVLENVAGGTPFVNDPRIPQHGGIHMGGGYRN